VSAGILLWGIKFDDQQPQSLEYLFWLFLLLSTLNFYFIPTDLIVKGKAKIILIA
jgi:hypothetical protein